jgi:uncharacterized protein with HEPN domain
LNRRSPRAWLDDISAAAHDAAAFAEGMDEPAFEALPSADPRTYRALKNALAEIGEAVKLLPADLLARHPGVDWRGWAGLRDIVSHQYFRLQTARLYITIREDIPPLLIAVTAELARRDTDR